VTSAPLYFSCCPVVTICESPIEVGRRSSSTATSMSAGPVRGGDDGILSADEGMDVEVGRRY